MVGGLGPLRNLFYISVTYSGVSRLFCFSFSLSCTTQELMVLKLQGSSSSSAFPPQSVNFDVGSDSNVDLNRFNPLQQFDHIGKKRLHQVFHLLLLNGNYSCLETDESVDIVKVHAAFPHGELFTRVGVMMCREVRVFKLSSKARSLKKMKVRHRLNLWLAWQTVKLSGLSRAQRSYSL